MGQVSYEFGPNFKQPFLAKEQATRAFEIIIFLIFFEQSSLSNDGHFIYLFITDSLHYITSK